MTLGKSAADRCRRISACCVSRSAGSIAALLILIGGGVTSPLAAQATQGTVTGTVVEAESRTPMAAVNVRVAGTNLQTLSDDQGRFSIRDVPFGPRTIEARRLGYKPARMQVDVGVPSSAVTLAMSADPLGLEAVVVTGYGTATRANVAGAIASIRTETVAELPTPQVDQILQGRVTGVQVVQNSGVPGSAITVRVRGASSIGASNEPLYVIDGVPLIQGNFSGINGSMGGQDIDALADLNPNEIESIDILKDASAAAIYGSRASNGVVMITPKRGAARARPEIRINSYYGTQAAWRIPSYLNNREYVELYNEAYANDGQNDCGTYICNYVGFSGDDIPVCDHDNPTAPVCEEFEVDPNINVDWLREIISPAAVGSVSTSIAGGSERTQYYVGGSYLKQDGIVSAYGFDRLNGRLNLDYAASDRLKLGTNVGLTHSITDRTRGDNTIYGPFANAIAMDPFTPVYDANGGYAASEWAGYDNPMGLLKENRAQERSIHIIGNAFANYTLRDGIDARLTVGLDHYNLRSKQYDSPIIGAWVGSEGHGIATNSHANKLVTDATPERRMRALQTRHWQNPCQTRYSCPSALQPEGKHHALQAHLGRLPSRHALDAAGTVRRERPARAQGADQPAPGECGLALMACSKTSATLSAIPGHEKRSSASARASRPRRRLSPSWFTTSSSAAAIARSSSRGTSHPVRPSSRIRRGPNESAATAGRSHAIPSTSTCPNCSRTEGSTTTSEAARKAGSSS
jgi:TonB-linked SusC/RagA family outer membrane protein